MARKGAPVVFADVAHNDGRRPQRPLLELVLRNTGAPVTIEEVELYISPTGAWPQFVGFAPMKLTPVAGKHGEALPFKIGPYDGVTMLFDWSMIDKTQLIGAMAARESPFECRVDVTYATGMRQSFFFDTDDPPSSPEHSWMEVVLATLDQHVASNAPDVVSASSQWAQQIEAAWDARKKELWAKIFAVPEVRVFRTSSNGREL